MDYHSQSEKKIGRPAFVSALVITGYLTEEEKNGSVIMSGYFFCNIYLLVWVIIMMWLNLQLGYIVKKYSILS